MAKVSLSGQGKSIEIIWSWFEDQKEALLGFRTKVFETIIDSSKSINTKFIGLTTDELNNYFNYSVVELEHLVCFDLISATEVVLRSDFYSKVYNKDKSEIGRKFRNLEKVKGSNISLETDIIGN